MLSVGSGGTKKQAGRIARASWYHRRRRSENGTTRERWLFVRDDEDEFGFCHKVSGNRNLPEEIRGKEKCWSESQCKKGNRYSKSKQITQRKNMNSKNTMALRAKHAKIPGEHTIKNKDVLKRHRPQRWPSGSASWWTLWFTSLSLPGLSNEFTNSEAKSKGMWMIQNLGLMRGYKPVPMAGRETEVYFLCSHSSRTVETVFLTSFSPRTWIIILHIKFPPCVTIKSLWGCAAWTGKKRKHTAVTYRKRQEDHRAMKAAAVVESCDDFWTSPASLHLAGFTCWDCARLIFCTIRIL